MLESFTQGIAERVLGVGRGLFGKVLGDYFLDLDADLKFARLQLALLRFEDFPFSLHGILLQVFLVGEDLRDVLHEVGHATGLGGQDLLGLPEGSKGLFLVGDGLGRLGLGDLFNRAVHMGDRRALQKREFRPAKAAESLLVNRFLARFDESLEELTVTIDDSLLGPAEAILVDLARGRVLISLEAPRLGLALHEFLGLDDLPDLLHQKVVNEDGVGSGDDLAELLDNLLDCLARFRDMRMRVFRFAGLEFFAGVGELITGTDHLLGPQSTERAAGLGQGDCSTFFPQPVGLEVIEEKGESAFHRGHPTPHPVLAVHLAAEPLFGGRNAVGPFLFFLCRGGEGQQARGGDGQGKEDATRFHCLLLH